MASTPIAQAKVPLEVGAPKIVRQVAQQRPATAASPHHHPSSLRPNQSPTMQHGSNRTLRRQAPHPPAGQQLPKLLRAPIRVRSPQLDDQVLELQRELLRLEKRPRWSVRETPKTAFLVTAQPLVASPPAHSVAPAHRRQARLHFSAELLDESKSLFHPTRLFPGHGSAMATLSKKCYPGACDPCTKRPVRTLDVARKGLDVARKGLHVIRRLGCTTGEVQGSGGEPVTKRLRVLACAEGPVQGATFCRCDPGFKNGCDSSAAAHSLSGAATSALLRTRSSAPKTSWPPSLGGTRDAPTG